MTMTTITMMPTTMRVCKYRNQVLSSLGHRNMSSKAEYTRMCWRWFYPQSQTTSFCRRVRPPIAFTDNLDCWHAFCIVLGVLVLNPLRISNQGWIWCFFPHLIFLSAYTFRLLRSHLKHFWFYISLFVDVMFVFLFFIIYSNNWGNILGKLAKSSPAHHFHHFCKTINLD